MAKKKNKNIVRYRRPLNINIGMIIFTLIFIYMAFYVYVYIKRDKIQFYEVEEGSIVNDTNYTGIILREETVKTTDYAGNINYYIPEGKRASVGAPVYSIDETGSMAGYLAQNPDADVKLNDDNLYTLKKQLSSCSMGYDDDRFGETYDEKFSLDASVLEYVNMNALGNMDNIMEQMGVHIQQVHAEKSGIISYMIDSFEGMDPSQVSAATFDRTNYQRQQTKSGDMIEIGAAVYKVITSEIWTLLFPMTPEDVTAYGAQKNLTVSFRGEDLTATGRFSIITGADGASYGRVDFDRYIVDLITERYVDFEIVSAKIEGLKIPVSAVTEKNFYLIPLEYLNQGGDSTETGFLKEIHAQDGSSSVVFVPTTIYNSTEEDYYIDMKEGGDFNAGDYIVKQDSDARYQIGASAPLKGVYNINKGYAVFKQIDILASTNDFYTIRKNMSYGLAVFDHIVLDAKTVTEGDLIYQ